MLVGGDVHVSGHTPWREVKARMEQRVREGDASQDARARFIAARLEAVMNMAHELGLTVSANGESEPYDLWVNGADGGDLAHLERDQGTGEWSVK